MSLDVYLHGPSKLTPCTCMECGNVHETVREEDIFSSNITHNLNKMAEAAGIYKHLWRPEEIGITRAHELIKPLEEGLRKLEVTPAFFTQFNAANGWGLYEHFVPFVREYLEACRNNPDSFIRTSR